MKEFTITYARREIRCTLDQKWQRSLSIQIKPDGAVIVRAPKLIPLPLIKKQVEEKASWIYKKLVYIELHGKTKAPKKYIEGESHFFLGKEYSLKCSVSSEDSVQIEGSNIHISSKRISPVIVKSLLNRFYHEEGVKILYERFEIAKKVFAAKNIIPLSLTYKPMKGKWGYCSHDNHICLNPELIKTPFECIDYVIYHELCHVRHHNHGPRFHALQKEMLPDYRLRKKKLDTFGS